MSAAALAAGGAGAEVVLVATAARRLARRARARPARRRLGPAGAAPEGSRPSAPASVHRLVRSAGWGAAADRWWPRWWIGLVVGVGGLLVTAGPALAAALVVLWIVAPWIVLRARAGRDRDQLEAALPAVLEDIARGLRGGLALPVAVARTSAADHGPWSGPLSQVAESLERGAALPGVLRRWGRTDACPGLALAVAALTLGAEAGGAQARAVDGVAATLRDRAAVRAEQVALSSQARASALVLAVTPVAFAALAAVVDPRTGRFLLHSVAGAGCLAAGGLLDVIAAFWMIRIADGPAR